MVNEISKIIKSILSYRNQQLKKQFSEALHQFSDSHEKKKFFHTGYDDFMNWYDITSSFWMKSIIKQQKNFTKRKQWICTRINNHMKYRTYMN
jgi:hypothetical protein